MNDVGIIAALVGGILTILAPCTFPLLPAYLGFLGGSGATADDPDGATLHRRVVRNGILFVIGFSIVFMFFGLISGVLGAFFIEHRVLISEIGGVIIILFGISMLGIIPFPEWSGRVRVPSVLIPGTPLSSLLLGFLFALGWSPCLGPILGSILVLAGTTGTALEGAFLLGIYALGLGIPFLLIAVVYGKAFRSINVLRRNLRVISLIAGILLIGIGVMLVLVQFGMLNVWAEELFGRGWYGALMEYM